MDKHKGVLWDDGGYRSGNHIGVRVCIAIPENGPSFIWDPGLKFVFIS